MHTPEELEKKLWKAIKSDRTLMLGLDGAEDPGRALVIDGHDHRRAGGERLGQHGADGEPSDGLHPHQPRVAV